VTRPQIWVVAGPNGAGKSTLAQRYLAGRLPVVNPDEIARAAGSSPIAAGRVALRERHALLSAGHSFAVETTLTGQSELDLMQRARNAGYKVNLAYVGLDDVLLSTARVTLRVRSGGHDVPLDDILRRFDRSTANLSVALRIAHRSWIVDNSGRRRRLLLTCEGARVKHISRALPQWAQRAIAASPLRSSLPGLH
jgi:predicted ABC-type ATPase